MLAGYGCNKCDERSLQGEISQFGCKRQKQIQQSTMSEIDLFISQMKRLEVRFLDLLFLRPKFLCSSLLQHYYQLLRNKHSVLL